MSEKENDKLDTYVSLGNLAIKAGERLGVPTVILVIVLFALNNIINSGVIVLQNSINEVYKSVNNLSSRVEMVIKENSTLRSELADLKRRVNLLEGRKKR